MTQTQSYRLHIGVTGKKSQGEKAHTEALKMSKSLPSERRGKSHYRKS